MQEQPATDIEKSIGENNRQEKTYSQETEDLSRALAKEKDDRREERFCFILLCIILLDIVFFSTMQNWAVPISILVLEMILLALIAKRLGVKEAVKLLNGIFNRISQKL